MSIERQELTFVVAELIENSSRCDNSIPLKELIATLTKSLEEIPQEFQSNAVLFIQSDHDSDSYQSVSVTVQYDRPETDDEIRARRKEEKQRQANSAIEREARELSEYHRLQKKFGEQEEIDRRTSLKLQRRKLEM